MERSNSEPSVQDTVIVILLLILMMLVLVNVSIRQNKDYHKSYSGKSNSEKWVSLDNLD